MRLDVAEIIFLLVSTFVILFFFKRGRIPVKYTLVWLFAIFIFVISLIFPGLLGIVSELLGFQIPSNMIFTLAIVILLFINLAITIIISGQNEKIKLLIQEISMLKSDIYKNYDKAKK